MKKIKLNAVYYFITKKEYDNFMKTAENQGYRWASGHKPTVWGSFNTCTNIKRGIRTYGTESDPRISCTSLDDHPYTIRWTHHDNEPPTIIEHLIRGNKTIVKLSNGKVGVARCHPDDKFDIYEGLRVATARAYGKPVEEPKVEPEQEPNKDVLWVKCVRGSRGGPGYSKFTEGKVYKRVDGNLIDDNGFNWSGLCKSNNPRMWRFVEAKFELYEELVEAPVETFVLSLDSSYVDLQQRVERLETAVIALTGRVNEHTRELKPWKRGKHE